MQLPTVYITQVVLLASFACGIPALRIPRDAATPVPACDFDTVNAACEIDFTIGDSGAVYKYAGKCQQQILFHSGTSNSTFYVCSDGSGPLPLIGGGGEPVGEIGAPQPVACDHGTVNSVCVVTASSATTTLVMGHCQKDVISGVGGGAAGTMNTAYKCL